MSKILAGLALVAAGGLIALRRAGPPPRALGAAEVARFALLHPSAARALVRLRAALAARGVQTFVGQTYQSAADAADAYSTGRSATTHSWHRLQRAVDLYVIDPRTGEPDLRAVNQVLYARLGATARALGWRWLGLGVLTNPTTGATFTDPQHLEWREGLTYAQAAAQVGL